MKSHYQPQPRRDFSITCQVCGRVFTKNTTESRVGVFKFCSPKCKALENSRRKRLKSPKTQKLHTLGKCLICGKIFTFEDYVTTARQHLYCSPRCKKVAYWKNRAASAPPKEARVKPQPTPKPKVAPAGFYIAKGVSLNSYTLEDDPWQSGRLPQSVTENQVFS